MLGKSAASNGAPCLEIGKKYGKIAFIKERQLSSQQELGEEFGNHRSTRGREAVVEIIDV